MKMVETWPTQQQDDSDVHPTDLDPAVAHVRVLTGATPHAVHLVLSQGTSIGRVGGHCEVVVDDARMSRKHARIERGIAGWHLQDLGSLNGGYVDGRGCGPGARVALFDGAVIRLGDTLMVFRTTAPISYGPVDSSVFPGISPNAATVRQRIDVLASGAGHVLIVGETGTGKEHVAQAIGQHRAPHPFVTLNCAELNRDLARSELFGHTRGAFTNANNNRPGLVDKAGDGVLFLDEIGELSLEVQPELLRFLEDGSYRALGSTDLRHSAARVVAATNVDLDDAVQNNRFRRDLLARLRTSNAPLQLPALRERREDILGWTQLFFRRINCDPGPVPWTVGALECLLLYSWEENLRGLEGAVSYVAEKAPQFPCGAEHLPQYLRAFRVARRAPTSPLTPDEPTPQSRPARPTPPRNVNSTAPSRPKLTQLMIEDALEQTGGRMRRAAHVLGIDRTKLYRLCKNLNIDFKAYRAPGAQPDDDEEDDDREDTGPGQRPNADE
jgi:DNA-binding NtrC family response regulator